MTLKLAAVPAGSMVDPCCCTCWDKFGDTMEVTVTGVELCGCFIMPGTPNRFFSATGWSGVNGVFNLPAVSPGNPLNTGWSGTIGTITLQEFNGTSSPPSPVCDGTEIGVPFDVDVTFEVQCFAEEGLGLQADITAGSPLTGTAAQIFASTDHTPETYFQPGDVVPNLVLCTPGGLGYYANVAAEGALTVTPP